MLYVLYSIHAEKGNEILMIEDSSFRVQGSRFKVQGSKGSKGSGGGFAAFLDDDYPISPAFPSRGSYPAGADRADMV